LSPDGPELTNEERLFVENVLIDGNRTRAYKELHPHVKYETAARMGHDWASRPHVAAEIAAGRQAQIDRFRLRADTVTTEVLRIAFSDLARTVGPDGRLLPVPQMPLDVRSAISSIKVGRERVVDRSTTTTKGKGKTTRTKTTVYERTIELRLWNKMEALDRLANMLGMKATLPPIEVLLDLLPVPVALQLRDLLVGEGPKNGTGK
jgi:hypothetical protein